MSRRGHWSHQGCRTNKLTVVADLRQPTATNDLLWNRLKNNKKRIYIYTYKRIKVSLFSIARRKRRGQKRKDREEKILDRDQKEELSEEIEKQIRKMKRKQREPME